MHLHPKNYVHAIAECMSSFLQGAQICWNDLLATDPPAEKEATVNSHSTAAKPFSRHTEQVALGPREQVESSLEHLAYWMGCGWGSPLLNLNKEKALLD